MARRSLPELHSRVTASASQFITEFQRADNQARRSATAIDREVSKIEKTVRKKFSVSDIGKSFLGGLGLGSGFAVASTASNFVTDRMREQKEHLKKMDEIWERMTKRSLDFNRTLMSPGDRVKSMREEMESLQAAYIKLATPRVQMVAVGGQNNTLWIEQIIPKTKEEVERLAALVEKMQELGIDIAKIEKSAADETAKKAAKMQEDAAKRMIEVMEWRTKVQLDNNAALEKEAEILLSRLATPQEEHAARLKRIETLYQSGKLSIEQYSRAMTESFKQLDMEEMKAVEDRLEDFFGELDRKSTTMLGRAKEEVSDFAREMNSMWNMVSDRAGAAFADMLVSGENAFESLTQTVIKSILEILARMAIINPILNAVFGSFGGWSMLPAFFGGGAPKGKARGGAVEPGYTYRVNEDGQEFFKPNVGGTIMPVGSSRGLAGDRGVIHFAPVFNVAAGVTRQELVPMLRQWSRGMLGQIGELQRRGRPISAGAF